MGKAIECLRIGSNFDVRFEGSEKVIPCGVIRGGIAFPSLGSPAYYCIFGRRTYVNANSIEPLVFLAEHKADLPRDLFQHLHEDARNLFCLEFYAEVDEANYEYYNQFDRYMERLNQRISLNQPDINDWQAGVLCILKYARDSALHIPEGTILADQLGKMTSADQQDAKRHEFYAVNALRCVIGSFETSPTPALPVKPSNFIY